jgi:hypothetical protein
MNLTNLSYFKKFYRKKMNIWKISKILGNKIIQQKRYLKSTSRRPPVRKAPKPKQEIVNQNDPWVSVKDEASGRIYWWNQLTNETTALDAPKPGTVYNIQPVYVAPPTSVVGGIGSMVAQGMAFGAGSSIAHHAIGSLFGGGGDGYHHSDTSPVPSTDSIDTSDDSWDV